MPVSDRQQVEALLRQHRLEILPKLELAEGTLDRDLP